MELLIFGSSNGLLPIYHQVITRTDAHLLLFPSFRTNSSEIFIKNVMIFNEENACENVC